MGAELLALLGTLLDAESSVVERRVGANVGMLTFTRKKTKLPFKK